MQVKVFIIDHFNQIISNLFLKKQNSFSHGSTNLAIGPSAHIKTQPTLATKTRLLHIFKCVILFSALCLHRDHASRHDIWLSASWFHLHWSRSRTVHGVYSYARTFLRNCMVEWHHLILCAWSNHEYDPQWLRRRRGGQFSKDYPRCFDCEFAVDLVTVWSKLRYCSRFYFGRRSCLNWRTTSCERDSTKQ